MVPLGLSCYNNILPENIRNSMYEYFYDMEDAENFKSIESSHAGEIIQFGYKYYNSIPILGKTIPPILRQLIDFVPKSKTNRFNQCVVNKYEIDNFTTAHTDSLYFGDTIACFSFGDSFPIIFRNDKTREKYAHTAEDNSLYVMTKDARYDWTYEIPSLESVETTRYLISFREVNNVSQENI